MANIHKGDICADGSRVRRRRHIRQVRRDAGHPRAFVKNAAVSDHDQACAGADFVEAGELRGQLRADAGGVSHCQRDHWFAGAMHVHMILTFS